MNILFVGDVVGAAGQRVLLANLPSLRARLALDFVVVNAENVAGGFGVTRRHAEDLLAGGVDVLTSGNHIWDKKEALDFIGAEPRLLRPHNYPPATPGSGWVVRETARGVPVGVLNVMGTVFMGMTLDCPFRCADAALAARPGEVAVVLVDFHAEATSEKTAMGWYLDGRVSAVVGSHTHVATADERVLPNGTAYITDAGMTGCHDSVIGMDRAQMLKRFVQKLPQRFDAVDGRSTLSAVVIEVDETSGRSRSIRRVSVTED